MKCVCGDFFGHIMQENVEQPLNRVSEIRNN